MIVRLRSYSLREGGSVGSIELVDPIKYNYLRKSFCSRIFKTQNGEVQITFFPEIVRHEFEINPDYAPNPCICHLPGRYTHLDDKFFATGSAVKKSSHKTLVGLNNIIL